eukprot:4849465-Amphidinium_carterae.2
MTVLFRTHENKRRAIIVYVHVSIEYVDCKVHISLSVLPRPPIQRTVTHLESLQQGPHTPELRR